MASKEIIYDNEELALLEEIEKGEWVEHPLSKDEREEYAQSAKYTKSLQEKSRRP